MLVMCAGVMEQTGGRMCVAAGNARIVHLFEVTQLERVVALHADAESACQALAQAARPQRVKLVAPIIGHRVAGTNAPGDRLGFWGCGGIGENAPDLGSGGFNRP